MTRSWRGELKGDRSGVALEIVLREAAIMARSHNFVPSAVLKDRFVEIFIHCDFEPFSQVKTAEQAKDAMEVWKKCVDVQQHFNDLSLRIRNFAITVVGVLLAAVGFTYQYGLETEFAGYRFAAGLGFVVAAVFAWGSFFLMDCFWYHILLRRAVSHASSLENQLNGRIPGIGLTNKISDASRSVRLFGLKVDSKRRLEALYIIGFLMLAIVLISLMLARPSRPITNPPPLPKAGQLNRPILVMLTWRGRDFPTVPAEPPAIEDFNDLTDAPRRA